MNIGRLIGRATRTPPIAAPDIEQSAAPDPADALPSIRIDKIIIATDGSIVVVGDTSTLTANTGSASSSGTVVLGSTDSDVSSGSSSQAEPMIATSGRSSKDQVAQIIAALSNALALQLSGRPVAIAGYEDHSVAVFGNDQVVTYDDSNVFINRDGPINANTGDTDSSGLNAVDVTNSTVRSGDHTENGENGENGEDGENGENGENGEDSQVEGTAANGPDDQPSAADDVDASDATDLDAGPPAAAVATGDQETAVSVDPDASTSAAGRHPLVIGGDGYDDVSIRTTGDRNIVTYDDSNVVIGGRGPVNAQIGDSDTSGAVVMGIRGSQVQSGNST